MSYDDDIKQTLQVLRNGGVILYPTDTVWGLGCDAANAAAVEKIYAIKRRAAEQSLVVLVDKDLLLNKYVKEVPAVAWELIELTETPLTIVYDDARGLAANVIAQDGSVAIRVTRDEFCKKLLHQFGKAIVSTSANFSGAPTPANFSEIDPELAAQTDYVVKWKQNDNSKNKASAIIRIGRDSSVKVIRK
jgi:L-threonylcarbamoyladenylate synthase